MSFNRSVTLARVVAYLNGMRASQAITVVVSRAIVTLCIEPFSTLYARIMLNLWGAAVGSQLRVAGRLRLHVEGSLSIGVNVTINSGSANNYVGGDRRMSMWVGRRGALKIEDGCKLSNSTIVCLRRVTVLRDTYVGGGCNIFDTDFHAVDAESRARGAASVPCGDVTIGPAAFVGAGCTILKHVCIGEGAVVGAGSLVTGRIPPFEVWAGVPAKRIKSLAHGDRSKTPGGEHEV
jgi:acetyltransferase-like isoleucine patch superfamily enzyme